MPTPRKLLCLLLIAVAIGLLYPGITQPVMTLSGDIEKSRIVNLGIDLLAGDEADTQSRQMLQTLSAFLGLDKVEGQVEAYRMTRSITGMAEELADNGNALVAVLIVTFSIVIPLLKLSLQFAALLAPVGISGVLLRVNAALSKWSMADVFVLALLIAYMAGRASGHMGDLLVMQAQLESGFWFFAGYCLFSIAAGIVMAGIQRPQGERWMNDATAG